ncbi:hypothetical protein QAD02_004397 [Eretmocerus hayati]|uniref:Uncharacterized protein n=1 Tax=Eretmocerus hayati TaxID=131215 RepID=A0ACC2NPF5_9HYME|nr:hypothetical protein QAD02_004397 [Eretmocerus hayati]
MNILRVLQLTLLALHLCGTKTFAFPPDIFDDRHLYTFDECEETLDLAAKSLTRFDRTSIPDDTCFKSLDLQSNNIEGFEDGIFSNLTNLEYLDLTGNKLSPTTLFSFGSVPSLKTLILYHNNQNGDHFTLDTKVYFPELTRLSLGGLNINSVAINWSKYFPQIEKLDVSFNPLASLNDFFRNIPTTLRSLWMWDMKLKKLRIQNLKNVTSLALDFNEFRSIKYSNCDKYSLCLQNLNGLESLSLARCDIALIEEHAFEHLTKLSYINLRGNKITRISSGTFGRFPSLSCLNISDNPLLDVSFIGELQNLTTLKMHSMDDNRAIESLFSLSSVPTKIQNLYLAENWMSSIPSRFLDNLQNIREIDLRSNQLSVLHPGSWQRNLKVINLYENRVSKIEDLHLSEARSLQSLDLRRNRLQSIDPEVIKALPEDLDLKL